MAGLEGVEGISASTVSARANGGLHAWTWYIQNQDMACMSACFLLCSVGLMQCKHTYMYIRDDREMSLSNDLLLLAFTRMRLPIPVDPGTRRYDQFRPAAATLCVGSRWSGQKAWGGVGKTRKSRQLPVG